MLSSAPGRSQRQHSRPTLLLRLRNDTIPSHPESTFAFSIDRPLPELNDPSLVADRFTTQPLEHIVPSASVIASPGRTNHGLLEASDPSNTVDPCRQRQHSRSGPVVATEERGFHRASLGKYPHINIPSHPESSSALSIDHPLPVFNNPMANHLMRSPPEHIVPSSSVAAPSGPINPALIGAPLPPVVPHSSIYSNRTNSTAANRYSIEGMLIYYQNVGGMNGDFDESFWRHLMLPTM